MAPSTDRAKKLRKSDDSVAKASFGDSDKALNLILDHLESLRSARPTLQIAGGKTDRTRDTISKIVDAALQVFTEYGHAGLSLRKVSDRAGIAVGNLTYHFPSKQALIDTMLREALTDYVEEHLVQFEADRDSPLEILLNVAEFYVRNARTSHQFFYQLWGFAGSAPQARALVRELYRPIGQFIRHLVMAANPKLTDIEVRQAVLQIFALEEGYKLFIGMGPNDSSAIQSAEADIRALTRKIVGVN